MLNIYTPIQCLKDGNNKTVCYYPTVEITTDNMENIDPVKLRQFQIDLADYMEKGLNKCLVKHQ